MRPKRMYDTEHLITRAESLIERLERLLPEPPPPTDWGATAFRWRTRQGRAWLQAEHSPHRLDPADLLCLERQKAEIVRNTRQFLAGRGANNLLLWGSRGTGKSSLIKAVFSASSVARRRTRSAKASRSPSRLPKASRIASWRAGCRSD